MFVDVNGTRLFFDVAGPGLRPGSGADDTRLVEVPTLLLLHGGPGSDHSAVKAPLLPLAEHYQLVWIDHRGNGRSARSDPRVDVTHWTLDQWADDVKAFCDTVGIVKPIVFGQSFGGTVAQAYGAKYPAHAKKLILSSIGARWDFEASMRRFAERGGPEAERVARAFWGRMDPDDIVAYRRVCLPLYAASGSAADARRMVLDKDDVMRHFLAPSGFFQRMDLRASLASVTCETLVLAGRLDPVIPWELSEELAASLTASSTPADERFACLDGCGHGVWRDRPDEALALIRRFVDR